ncbi:hypothetical protein ACOBQX_25760 [Actinokineospora sp. G85]|uniref:hypothetical protein n=1 Tax=Actinokineospora sp. G85 TaxID=3406626 RepID=UPI003C70D7E6
MTGTHGPVEPSRFGGITVRSVVISLMTVGIAALVGAAAQKSPDWGVFGVLAGVLPPDSVALIVTASTAVAVYPALQRWIR